ncbi:MAG: PD-(D/E)XK nuclease family protein [Peptococcaceae bacterium]|nr:PD-(D/E)XK nuclease family protein [Peptococcaceae bacterium]
MSLRFILGRAGTGKTSRCLEDISGELAGPGPAIVFLVPEQATLQTEYALLGRVSGVLRAQVLSFRRLAYRILLEAGGLTRPHIGDPGKQMVLRALTNRRRSELRVFQRMAGQAGFGAALAGVLSELKAYRLAPRDLAAALPRLSGPLREKLGDLTLLYGDMEEYLAGRYTDPDDYLALAAARAPRAASLAGAWFWLDAFTGFTPAEYLVLEAVLGMAARMTVALCLDEEEIFVNARETRATLELLARRSGHAVEPPVVLAGSPPRFAGFPACAHLDRHFFRRPGQPAGASGISLTAAADRRAEVETAAGEMVRLAREEGLRFREMLVLVRDLAPYRDLLTTVLADFDIPFFIDYKRPVAGHPLADLIRGALGCALEDWSYAAVFRYLKTGLVNVPPDQVDELENYVLARGVKGSRWTSPWGGEELERTRREVAGPLAALQRALDRAATVREMTEALYLFLVELEVPGRLAEWEKTAGLAEAAEHGQVFAAVVELFDQVVETLGGEQMSLAEYASVLEDGLGALRLGLIPPGLDEVLVGSLDRSRAPQVRAAFILGANDGLLPARPPSGGFFTDAERERLSETGLVLAPGARRRLLDEEYLVYVALTRASERLHVSYALTGPDGAQLSPSLVVNRLRELLPGVGGPPPALVTRPAHALSTLALKLREAKTGLGLDDTWRAVYNWARVHRSERLALVTSALDYTNRENPLPRETRLFQSPLPASVSRLERFRACPFAFFAGYGLRLKERPVYELSPPDLGWFFHRALHLVGEYLAQTSRAWGDLSADEGAALARRITGELAPSLEILLSTARLRHLAGKLGRLVERSVQALSEHDRRGGFHPFALEAGFGPQGEIRLPAFELDGGDILELTGRIDRIDLARDSLGREYIRITDYKSGAAEFSLNDVYQGLSLQLMVYLYAVLAYRRSLGPTTVLPGGVFYFRVQDPLPAVEGPAGDTARLVLREFRLKGLVLGDPGVIRLMDNQLVSGHSDLVPAGLRGDGGIYGSTLGPAEFEALLRHVRDLVMATGREILDGVVDITPYRHKNTDACRFCSYRPVCRFDPVLSRDAYRRIDQAPRGDIAARLREGDEAGD